MICQPWLLDPHPTVARLRVRGKSDLLRFFHGLWCLHGAQGDQIFCRRVGERSCIGSWELNPTYVCTIFHGQYESFMSILLLRQILKIYNLYSFLRTPTLFYCKWLCPRLYICFPCIVQRLSLPIPDPFGPLTCEVEEAKEGFARSQLEEESGSPEGSRSTLDDLRKNVRPVIGF